jgi:hypothetical protein
MRVSFFFERSFPEQRPRAALCTSFCKTHVRCVVYAHTIARPSVRPEAPPLPTCQALETDRPPHRGVGSPAPLWEATATRPALQLEYSHPAWVRLSAAPRKPVVNSWIFAFSHPLLCTPLDSRSAVTSIASHLPWAVGANQRLRFLTHHHAQGARFICGTLYSAGPLNPLRVDSLRFSFAMLAEGHIIFYEELLLTRH